MKVESDIFQTSAGAQAESDCRALADIAAGKGVPHELVREWLLKWGTPDETPIPPEWLK